MRVVLDANIIVSFLLTGGETISSIFDFWEEKTFIVLISDEVLLETSQVLDRFVHEGKIDNLAAMSLKRKLEKETEKIGIVSKLDLSRDKKDNRYLECAKDGKADYLVSGDKHLLNLKELGETKIIPPRKFMEILEG